MSGQPPRRHAADVMTVAEFCANYRISRSAFYRFIAAGHLSAERAGGRTFIRRAEANRWMTAVSSPPAGEPPAGEKLDPAGNGSNAPQ